jgi:hypothetical protein
MVLDPRGRAQAGGPRRGFTVIDLLVTVGGLLFLGSMLAPAVFQVRRAAARTQAANNLRQIGIAVHNYDSASKRLPPIVGKGIQGQHGSILYHLLPFDEEQPLHQKGPVWQAETMGVVLPLYLDPRDKSAPGNKYEGWLATTNFAASWLAFGKGEKGIGNAFPDGTSNTIMFAERYQMCNGQPNAWAYDRLYYWAPMFAYHSTAKFQKTPTQAECDPALAQSLDASGAMVVMADVAIRHISDGISPETWRAALTPDGGEPLGDDF